MMTNKMMTMTQTNERPDAVASYIGRAICPAQPTRSVAAVLRTSSFTYRKSFTSSSESPLQPICLSTHELLHVRTCESFHLVVVDRRSTDRPSRSRWLFWLLFLILLCGVLLLVLPWLPSFRTTRRLDAVKDTTPAAFLLDGRRSCALLTPA
jgi:hypothetical protein